MGNILIFSAVFSLLACVPDLYSGEKLTHVALPGFEERFEGDMVVALDTCVLWPSVLSPIIAQYALAHAPQTVPLIRRSEDMRVHDYQRVVRGPDWRIAYIGKSDTSSKVPLCVHLASMVHVKVPKSWYPEQLENDIADKLRQQAPSGQKVYGFLRGVADEPCKLAPYVTATTRRIMYVLSKCQISLTDSEDPIVQVAQEVSELHLAPGLSFYGLAMLFKNLALGLEVGRNRLPGKRFFAHVGENLASKDPNLDQEAIELDAIVDNYYQSKDAIDVIICDKTRHLVPIFFDGGTFSECLEYAKQRKKELGK